MTPLSFRPVSDCGVLVEFGETVSDETQAAVLALDRALADTQIPAVLEVVPALVNLMVVFDPVAADHDDIREQVEALWPLQDPQDQATMCHDVPVCFDPELTPDLSKLATARGIHPEQVIQQICAARLKVGMYGFAPGYAYLTGVPYAVQVPRKQQPVPNVPKGSVLVAGSQALITTLRMPTGWHIIGRSPFEVMRTGPDTSFEFEVGDTLRFVPIGRADLPGEMQTP